MDRVVKRKPESEYFSRFGIDTVLRIVELEIKKKLGFDTLMAKSLKKIASLHSNNGKPKLKDLMHVIKNL